MSAKIDILPVQERKQLERREEVVTLLKQLLAEAEKGDIDSVVVIRVAHDGHLTSFSSSTPNRYEMVGRLEALKLRYLDEPAHQEE